MAVSNATNLEVNKLLVSSSHRISGSNSSWRYEVKGDVLKCGPEAVFAISDVQVPHSWYNVTAANSRPYIRIRTSSSLPTVWADYTVVVPSSNYSGSQLASQLATQLSALTASNFAVQWSSSLHKFSIQESSGHGFMILSDKNLRDHGFDAYGFQPNLLRSLNLILATPDTDVPDSASFQVSWTGGISTVIRLPSVYLRCPQLSGGTIAEDGTRDVIKRITVTTEMGEYQTAELGALTSADYASCAGKTIKGLDFRLTSADGTLIDLGGEVSFSIVFLSERPM